MATLVVSLVSACAGGGHLTVSARVDGAAAEQFSYTADEILEPLPTETKRDTLLGIMRLHFKGKTKSQARTELTAGVTMVI